MRYSLAKQPPHQNLTVEKITLNFGTTDFLPALTKFLRNSLPGTTITPTIRDRFDAYKQLVIFPPSNRYLGDRIVRERVRTTPSIAASGRALAKPPHFDTAFVVEDPALYKTEGGISGVFLFLFSNEYLSNFDLVVSCRTSCCSYSTNFQPPSPVRIIPTSTRVH